MRATLAIVEGMTPEQLNDFKLEAHNDRLRGVPTPSGIPARKQGHFNNLTRAYWEGDRPFLTNLGDPNAYTNMHSFILGKGAGRSSSNNGSPPPRVPNPAFPKLIPKTQVTTQAEPKAIPSPTLNNPISTWKGPQSPRRLG